MNEVKGFPHIPLPSNTHASLQRSTISIELLLLLREPSFDFAWKEIKIRTEI